MDLNEKGEEKKVYVKMTVSIEQELLKQFGVICRDIGLSKSGYISATMKGLVAMQDSKIGEVYENLVVEMMEKDKGMQEMKRLAELGRKVEKGRARLKRNG